MSPRSRAATFILRYSPAASWSVRRKEGRDRIKASFQKYASEDEFKVAVLDRGMTYTPIGLNQKDAQFIESRNFSVEEVSRFTGIPQYMLQSGKQAYSSNEQQQLDFVISTLQPYVTQWEEEFQYKLLRTDQLAAGLYLRMNATDTMPLIRAPFW